MAKNSKPSVGELLRKHRVEVLKLNSREAADLLGVSQTLISMWENNVRALTEEHLVSILREYRIPEAQLRAAASRPAAVVKEVAGQDATAAAAVPEVLRIAKNFTPQQWDALIEQSRRIQREGGKQ